MLTLFLSTNGGGENCLISNNPIGKSDFLSLMDGGGDDLAKNGVQSTYRQITHITNTRKSTNKSKGKKALANNITIETVVSYLAINLC